MLLLVDDAPGHPKGLIRIHNKKKIKKHNKMNAVFMPANTMTILQHMDQGVILTLKTYY